jgi:hypothetical protein
MQSGDGAGGLRTMVGKMGANDLSMRKMEMEMETGRIKVAKYRYRTPFATYLYKNHLFI